MFKNRKLALSIQLASLGVAGTFLSAIFGAHAFANESSVENMASTEEVVYVTGSRIRRTESEAANPLISISAEDIATQGYLSTYDILNELPQNSGGSINQQQSFSFTPSASTTDLRGVGIGKTLVLLNGKRLANYPIPANGSINFVDTSNIPLGAIERLEVLTNGASAIYGSDAMGGVANIILKDEFDGVEVSSRIGDSKGGGAASLHFSLLSGLSGDKSKLMFYLEHENVDALNANQRMRFGNLGTDLALGSEFGRYSSYGASVRGWDGATDPAELTFSEQECIDRGMQPMTLDGANNCGFNRSGRRDLSPEKERTSALLNYSLSLTEDLELYTRLNFTQSETLQAYEPIYTGPEYFWYVGLDVVGNPDPGNVTIEAYNIGEEATFSQAGSFGGDFDTLADWYYYPTRRWVELGDRRSQTALDNYNVLGGLKGLFNDGWSWNLDWQFSRSEYDEIKFGYSTYGQLFDYLSSGPSGQSIFDEMTAQEVAAASYSPWTKGESTFTGFSANVEGEMFTLPAGDIAWAFGMESYREWFGFASDEASTNALVPTHGGASGEGKRDYSAAYAESLLPLTDSLKATFALRMDSYSDFGSHTSPQLGMEFRPIDEVLIRALYANTFRAPDLQRIYGDPTNGFANVFDPLGCQALTGATVVPTTVDANSGFDACSGTLQINSTVGPNADLGPEEGSNWNIGLVLDFGNTDASIDIWDIDIDSIVDVLQENHAARNFNTYEHLITRNENGVIDSINATAQNLSFRHTAGVDFNLGHRLSLEEKGQLYFQFNASYLSTFEQRFDINSETVDMIASNRVPEWRMQFSSNWEIANFTTSLFVNYIGEMNGAYILDGGVDDPTIDSFYKINLATAWKNENLTLRAGINNITDEGPRLDPTDNQLPHYPQEYHDALGQNYYLKASYKFD